MPRQKPGRSKQDYATPDNFLYAATQRLAINDFTFDYAASAKNSVAARYWTKSDDSLRMTTSQWADRSRKGWGWLNPPFSDIGPWASLCRGCALAGGHVAFLVPASVGANWFRDYVDGKARVLFLNGRLAFMPRQPTWLYPKDCILALYGPDVSPGYEVWTWNRG